MNKVVSIGAIALLVSSVIGGCTDYNDADHRETAAQEKLTLEANMQAGMPNITSFTEKKNLKMLYELRDQAKLPTYTYTQDMNGHLHLLVRSVGFPFPYATQYSNPMKPMYFHESYGTIPQAEPNGLFMPASADGTWVFAVAPDGSIQPLYSEPRVITSTFPLSEN